MPTNSVEEAAAPSDDGGLDIAPILVAGVPAVLAAGIVVRLDRIRRRRSRRLARSARSSRSRRPTCRRPRRRWRAIADHESADWVDTTLRYLTWAVRSTGAPVSVVGVRTGVNGLELLLSAPARQGAPRFAADESGWQWRLKCGDLSEIRGIAADEPPYTPGLVTLGTADDGSTVLVDVEQLGLTQRGGRRHRGAGVAQRRGRSTWPRPRGRATSTCGWSAGWSSWPRWSRSRSSTWTPCPPPSRGPSRPPAGRSACDPRPRPPAAPLGGEPWPPLTIVDLDPGRRPADRRRRRARPGRRGGGGRAGAPGHGQARGRSRRLRHALPVRPVGPTQRRRRPHGGRHGPAPDRRRRLRRVAAGGREQPDLVRTAPVAPAALEPATSPSPTEAPATTEPVTPAEPATTPAADDAESPASEAAEAAEPSTDPVPADPSSGDVPAVPEVTSVQPELAGSPAPTSLPPPPPPPPASAAKAARSSTPWPAAPTSPPPPEADEDVPPLASWAAPAAAETVDAADVRAKLRGR